MNFKLIIGSLLLFMSTTVFCQKSENQSIKGKYHKLYLGIGNSFLPFLDNTGNSKNYSLLSEFYLGYELINQEKISVSIETWYTRIPENIDTQAAYISTNRPSILVYSFNTRETIDLMSSFKWKPGKKKFSFESNIGFGLTYHSTFLSTEAIPPSGSRSNPAFVNQNKIYFKPDPHLSLGLRAHMNILSDRLALVVGVSHRITISDNRTVNGRLQGYKINPSVFQIEYERFESRFLQNYNFGSAFLGLEFRLF